FPTRAESPRKSPACHASGDLCGPTARMVMLTTETQPGHGVRLRGSRDRTGLVSARTYGPNSPVGTHQNCV
ncbi:MAG: hypothetical protein LAT83_16895, partial [Kiritimatiellae bacterium]|nr:hypothetical protein [Kiritimatiellia bacterium]